MNRYHQYKKVNISWLEQVPSHWTEVPLKMVASCNDEVLPESTPPDRQINYVEISDVSATLGIKNFTRMLFAKSPSRARRIVRNGDILVSTVRTYLKAIASVQKNTENLVASTGFAVIRPRSNNAISDYLGKVALTDGFIGEIISRSVGVSYPAINASEIMHIKIPLPPVEEQQKIAQFLDFETAKIDALIDEQKRLIELLTEEVKSLALTRYSQNQTFERLENLASLQNRPVQIEECEEYTALGLYNRGRGLFHKKPVNGKDMGDSSFCYIKNDDLILSGQFAWEGAVAMATDSEKGCVVSHRYPVLRGKDGILVTEYLFALLLTKHGNFILNECSRGAAGRNRPLNTNALMKWKIRAPLFDHQLKVRNAVIKLREVRSEAASQKKLLLERRSALISAAVTGKIDVRDWQPPQGSDTVDKKESAQTEMQHG